MRIMSMRIVQGKKYPVSKLDTGYRMLAAFFLAHNLFVAVSKRQSKSSPTFIGRHGQAAKERDKHEHRVSICIL